MEIWVYAYKTKETYMVSNLGRFKSFHPRFKNSIGVPRTPGVKASRYAGVWMKVGESVVRKSFHRLVWESFHGPIPKDKCINHKNGIKLDNRLENLEVVTPAGNLQHAYDTGLKVSKRGADHQRAKLTISQVRKVRKLLSTGKSQWRIAALFGVHQCTISDIKNNYTYRAD